MDQPCKSYLKASVMASFITLAAHLCYLINEAFDAWLCKSLWTTCYESLCNFAFGHPSWDPFLGTTVSVVNFSKFSGPVCQIPWLTAANFPHIVINLLWPPVGPGPNQICSIWCRQLQLTDAGCRCLPNKLPIFQINSAQCLVRAQVAVAYFTAQLCLHVVINYLCHLKPAKICCICRLITSQYQILQNSVKT